MPSGCPCRCDMSEQFEVAKRHKSVVVDQNVVESEVEVGEPDVFMSAGGRCRYTGRGRQLWSLRLRRQFGVSAPVSASLLSLLRGRGKRLREHGVR